jgi:hypothetical protein
VTAENVEIYLAPLVEEFLQLWEGVNVVDVSSERSNCIFYSPSTTYVVYSQRMRLVREPGAWSREKDSGEQGLW